MSPSHHSLIWCHSLIRPLPPLDISPSLLLPLLYLITLTKSACLMSFHIQIIPPTILSLHFFDLSPFHSFHSSLFTSPSFLPLLITSHVFSLGAIPSFEFFVHFQNERSFSIEEIPRRFRYFSRFVYLWTKRRRMQVSIPPSLLPSFSILSTCCPPSPL